MNADIYRFNDLICSIEDCIDWYEKKEIDHTRYKINLSNGKSYEIEYNKNSIAHLLGINIDYLKSTGFYEGCSYDVLKKIVENPNPLFDKIKNGYLNVNNIFSDHIEKKLSGFKNNSKVLIEDISFVVDYNNQKSFLNGEIQLNGEIYIASENFTNHSLSVIGFKKSPKGIYSPITNLYFDNQVIKEKENFLNRLLKNQDLVLIEGLQKNFLTPDYEIKKSRYYYSIEDKLKKLKTIKRYADLYNSSIDTRETSLYYIDKASQLYEEKKNVLDAVYYISKAIKNRSFINVQKVEEQYGELKDSLLELVGNHNDSLRNNYEDNEEENVIASEYKALVKELKEQKETIKNLNDTINGLQEKNNYLREENTQIKDENNSLKEKHQKIRTILG